MVHEGVRFPCKECDHIFKSPYNLKKHVKLEHVPSSQNNKQSSNSINKQTGQNGKVLKFSESAYAKTGPVFKMPRQITLSKVPAFQVPRKIAQNRQISFNSI